MIWTLIMFYISSWTTDPTHEMIAVYKTQQECESMRKDYQSVNDSYHRGNIYRCKEGAE